MSCSDVNIKPCPYCDWNELDNTVCWLDTYRNEFAIDTKNNIKKWVLYDRSSIPAKYRNKDLFYLKEAVIKFYPEHVHMVEKLLLLI